MPAKTMRRRPIKCYRKGCQEDIAKSDTIRKIQFNTLIEISLPSSTFPKRAHLIPNASEYYLSRRGQCLGTIALDLRRHSGEGFEAQKRQRPNRFSTPNNSASISLAIGSKSQNFNKDVSAFMILFQFSLDKDYAGGNTFF
jgi:hypothetical protein